MARGKKKKSLTPEECLQAALVPESEQPYSVPENWCWTKGCAFLKPMETKHPEGEVFRYIDIDAIDNKKQQVTEPKTLLVKDAPSRASRKLRTGDTIFSMVRPYLMNIAYIDETISNSIASTGFYVCTPAENVNPLYLYYLMTSPYTVEGLNRYMKGDNSPSIRKDDIENYPYPIPPLAEQQRIVGRIESLFAKLDEAKQKAQDALDSFETRKAAILHKAFAGELTVQWRKEHGTGMESWQAKKYSEICNIVRGGSPRPAGSLEFYGGNIPFMKVADITRNTGPYVNSTEYTIKEAGLKKTRMVDRNTLLLTNSGATLGVPAICTFKTTFNDGIAAFLGLNPDTLLFHYYFWTSKTADLRAINKGAAQPNLNTDIIGNVEISLPRENEQREIVRILDVLLAKEQQAKEAAEGVLEQIDLIKKAILARAFRGQLGTNDPTEESAQELMKKFCFKNAAERES